MSDTTTTPPVARHSVGDVHEFCTPELRGATLAMTFEDGRTDYHDLASFTVKASIGSYKFESDQTSFTLTFVDKSTGAAMSVVAAAGAVAVLGSAAAGVSAGASAVRHINATTVLDTSGYNGFYDPLKAVAGEFKESWRFRPAMLVRYALVWVALGFFVGGAVLMLLAIPAVGLIIPSSLAASALGDSSVGATLLGYVMMLVLVTTSPLWVPVGRSSLSAMMSMMAQSYWATPPQQSKHLAMTAGRAADNSDRTTNVLFYNQPRWISVVTPYLALMIGLFALWKQYKNPEIDVGNDGPMAGTIIFVAYFVVQLIFAVKMLIDSRMLQSDEGAWMEANVTSENSSISRVNLLPLLRHGVFAALLLMGATALFTIA